MRCFCCRYATSILRHLNKVLSMPAPRYLVIPCTLPTISLTCIEDDTSIWLIIIIVQLFFA
jgi:hypothetical protein